MPIPTYIAPSILKYLMYLLNVYSVFKVRRGICPTLTYRTLLGKKRNTKNEKNQKKFLDIKAKAHRQKSRWAEIHYSDVLKAKKDLQLFSRRSSSDLGVLSVIGGDLQIFHPRNGE